MRRLIINADDFGLTSGVNRAVVELHHHGSLSSATLMANAAATGEAIDLARKSPSLGVGCHIVLVDGTPVSPAGSIPSLCAAGQPSLHPTLGRFLAKLLTGRISAAEIEAEAAAQLALLRGQGLQLTHVDTHKHTHMFPAVLRPLLRAARAAGISAVRNPFEPAWAVAATPGAPIVRQIEVSLLRRLEPAFRRIVAEEGFRTTDGAIGVLATGTLNAAAIASLLGRMPEGTWELVTHPGHNDQDLARERTRLRESRQVEFEALLRAFPAAGIELIDFSALKIE